jgi:hypothetical protein
MRLNRPAGRSHLWWSRRLEWWVKLGQDRAGETFQGGGAGEDMHDVGSAFAGPTN